MKVYNARVGVRRVNDIKSIDNGTPQYLLFACSANPSKGSIRKLVETFGLQKNYRKKLDHEDFIKTIVMKRIIFGISI